MIFEATSEYKGTSNKNFSQVEELLNEQAEKKDSRKGSLFRNKHNNNLGVKVVSNAEDLLSSNTLNNARDIQYSDRAFALNNNQADEEGAKSAREKALSEKPMDRRFSKQSQGVSHQIKTPRESRRGSNNSKSHLKEQVDEKPLLSSRSKGSANEKAKFLLQALHNERKTAIQLNLQATREQREASLAAVKNPGIKAKYFSYTKASPLLLPSDVLISMDQKSLFFQKKKSANKNACCSIGRKPSKKHFGK